MTEFIVEEAAGTRHEAQIAASIEAKGGIDAAVVEMAGNLDAGQCAFLVVAPDSTVRALAIATLPERQGD